ncbi:Calreticulin like [Actinidia chinensis var. chinensis]|uniref:Calreticulin like n=1 Tax=Actinidia chinensis var. chinensis TaxID=1590841 RepID=A0A2R6S108_ACTCC|nr:Calreticulin like [Actinidia chinensis var. chinensis]
MASSTRRRPTPTHRRPMRTPPTESTSSSRSSARPPTSSKKNNSRRTNLPSSMQSPTSKMRPTTIPDMFGDIDKAISMKQKESVTALAFSIFTVSSSVLSISQSTCIDMYGS